MPHLTSLYHFHRAGEYGDRSYPGNCGGRLIRDLLLFLHGLSSSACRSFHAPCTSALERSGPFAQMMHRPGLPLRIQGRFHTLSAWLLPLTTCRSFTRKRCCGIGAVAYAFRLADTHAEMCVFGATGSGKGTGEHKSRAGQAHKCTEHEHKDGSAR
jgi:hypothetical protein